MGIVLGLTGGIATGKSTASQVFSQMGFPIVDADKIAREVVAPNTPGLNKLVSLFGTEILTKDQSLDRKKLSRIVFSDESKRICLNQALDSYIRTDIYHKIDQLKKISPLVVADIPLLYEANYDTYVDLVAVVYLPETLQVSRLMTRDSIDEKEALGKIQAQCSIEKKKQKATIIFDNQGTKKELEQQIKSWIVNEGLLKNNKKYRLK